VNRLDYRNLDQFKKDIYFSTKLEEFWFKLYLKQICSRYDAIEYDNTGTDNSGTYQRVATKAADYTIHLTKSGATASIKLDIKWAPTAGKATFKVKNLEHYIKDDIKILLFYNIGDKRLNKPKDHNIKTHIERITENLENIRYSIILPPQMQQMLNTYKHKISYYMGNKMCIEVPSEDFGKYFKGNVIKI